MRARESVVYVGLLCTLIAFTTGFVLGGVTGLEQSSQEWEKKLIEGQHGFYHPETGEFELRELQIIRQMPRGLDA